MADFDGAESVSVRFGRVHNPNGMTGASFAPVAKLVQPAQCGANGHTTGDREISIFLSGAVPLWTEARGPAQSREVL
jgi:hypothetical protein